jgi:hypothetical protein
MTLEELRTSLDQGEPPPGLPPLVHALWLAGRGQWDAAHKIAQDVDTPDGAWVHAHLHRQEGDIDNARYWYARAGRELSEIAIEREWEAIVRCLLAARE